MGLFNKKPKSTESKNNTSKQNNYAIPSAYSSDCFVTAYNISNQSSVTHSNNEKTSLMLGRITKYHENNVIFFDDSDYIAFEIPQGQEINEQIMKAVMEQYDRQVQYEGGRRQSCYLGRLRVDQNTLVFKDPSATIAKYVQDIVSKDKARVNTKHEQSVASRKQSEENYREKLIQETDRRIAEDNAYRDQIAKKRKANPTLTRGFNRQTNGKTYMSYDGVDLISGDILRMRYVDKIGKDGAGTYLYTAYLSEVESEDAVEFLDSPVGFPVCFTLPERLEDISANGNAEKIETLLGLLSGITNERGFTQNKLAFIGGIDKNGQFIPPDEVYYSPNNTQSQKNTDAISRQILKLQRDFERGRNVDEGFQH